MDQPVILCGLGRVGGRVLEYLESAGLSVVVVDNSCPPGDPRLGKARLIRGDCRQPDVLREAGVTEARGALILTSDDLVNISAALAIRRLHPDVRVVIRVFNQNLIARLGKAVHNVFALSTASLTAPLLTATALTGQGLGTFRAEGVRRQVGEVTIGTGSPLRGQTVQDVAARHDAQVVAHLAQAGPERFLIDVDLAATLEAGDHLVVCGERRKLASLLSQADDDVLAPVLWAGWLRRHARAAWQTLSEVDLAVKICTAVLVVVLFVSTLLFHFGTRKDSLAEGLYRTVSLMASGDDMHGEELPPEWLRVYASALRILGAVLTAAFTAIVTNYLLRARLGGALEVRRIPDKGHVVVCGLGSIGFRVVEELLGQEERVVVVEQERDGRFVATARRLGVAVVTGDATVGEVLRQAHAATARAVIAATSNDLVNLEVALLVRELNPKQRVVLCLTDSHLAQALREAANVRFALSVPALAAPAFVAALFGDRVCCVFLAAGRLLVAVDLVVQPGDTALLDQSVRSLAVDYRLLPLAVLDASSKVQEKMLSVRLQLGHRLLAILALPDLERLYRREAAPGEYAVEVTAFPLPTRSWVALLLRNRKGLSAEAAEAALNQLPVCVGEGLTRGQAEDLMAQLTRERVTACLRRQGMV